MDDFTRATEIAQKAVLADRANNIPAAIEFYTQAAELLIAVLRFEQNGAKRTAITAAVDNYLTRAEELKRIHSPDSSHLLRGNPSSTAAGAAASLPSAPAAHGPRGAGMPMSAADRYAPDGSLIPHQQSTNDPSLQELANTVAKGALIGVIAAGSAAKQANDQYQITAKLATAAVATGTKAKEINEEYKVAEKISAGAKKTVETAAQINRDYRVVENVKGAVKTTYESAVELDRKHQIHQKLGVCAKAAWEKTKEVDQTYGVTQKIGTGMLTALNWTAAQATKALAKPAGPPPIQGPPS